VLVDCEANMLLSLLQLNPRSTAIRAVAKANGLDLDIVEVDTTKPSAEFLKANPLSKVPTFTGADGYTLTECMAIAIYSKFTSRESSF
jgi:elongation factor 1-gamma